MFDNTSQRPRPQTSFQRLSGEHLVKLTDNFLKDLLIFSFSSLSFSASLFALTSSHVSCASFSSFDLGKTFKNRNSDFIFLKK